MSGRFEGQPGIPEWDIAVLCFRGAKGSAALVEAVRARPIGRKLLWGMEETAEFHSVYEYETDGKRVGVEAVFRIAERGTNPIRRSIEEVSELLRRRAASIGSADDCTPRLQPAVFAKHLVRRCRALREPLPVRDVSGERLDCEVLELLHDAQRLQNLSVNCFVALRPCGFDLGCLGASALGSLGSHLSVPPCGGRACALR